MKKTQIILSFLFLFVMSSGIFATVTENVLSISKQAKIVPGRLLVRFKENTFQSDVIFKTKSNKKYVLTGEKSIDQVNVKWNIHGFKKANDLKRRIKAFKKGNKREEMLYNLEEKLDQTYVLEFSPTIDVKEVLKDFKSLSKTEIAGPDYYIYKADIPYDPYWDHWGHQNSGQLRKYNSSTGKHDGEFVGWVGFDADATKAWDVGYGTSNVVIAIIDTGVDMGHPDLRLAPGYDFGDNDLNPDDDSADPGHGTACAGVAAAIAKNSIGVAGIAGGCSIMPLKVADSTGQLKAETIVQAINYAIDHDVDVISMSIGATLDGSNESTLFIDEVERAVTRAYLYNIPVFAASGNENNFVISFPASSRYVIAVGAASPDGHRKSPTTADGENFWGSNYGSDQRDASGAVDILGPTILNTTDIRGTKGYNSGDYSFEFNGTSSATPYVAGVAALIKSKYPTWDTYQIRDRIMKTAIDIWDSESGEGWDKYSGYGMINAGRAVNPTGELQGYIKNSGGLPIEGVKIEINGKSTVTNSSGFYSILSEEGVQSVKVMKENYIDEVRPTTILYNQVVNFNVSLLMTNEGSQISGTIQDSDGKPISKAKIQVIGGLNTESNINGVYSIGLKPGQYTIEVTHSGYDNGFVTLNTVAGQNYTKDFILPKAIEMRMDVILSGNRKFYNEYFGQGWVPVTSEAFSHTQRVYFKLPSTKGISQKLEFQYDVWGHSWPNDRPYPSYINEKVTLNFYQLQGTQYILIDKIQDVSYSEKIQSVLSSEKFLDTGIIFWREMGIFGGMSTFVRIDLDIPQNIFLENKTISGQRYYRAKNLINLKNVLLNSGSDVTFESGAEVEFDEGFDSQDNAQYETKITTILRR